MILPDIFGNNSLVFIYQMHTALSDACLVLKNRNYT